MVSISPGQTFSRLKAVGPSPTKGKWLFSCSCGSVTEKRPYAVKSGATRSCGCLHLERCRSGLNQTKHGQAKVGQVTRLHAIWRGMKKRCNPQNNPSATRRYAARGVAVCDEWRDSFPAFKAWADANGYAADLTIDRIDVNGPYSPENCRWATMKAQCRNRTTTRWIEIDGERLPLAEWLERTGVSSSAFAGRQNRGWSERRSLGFVEPLC